MTSPSTQNSPQQAEALALAFLARVWGGSSNDLTAIDELMTEDYQITSAGTTIRGRQAFTEWVRVFHSVLLDARNEVVEVFANSSGDRVVARWVCSGRNNGIFGLPPNGRLVTFTGIAIWRVQDGRLAECWVERAALEAFQALSDGDSPS